MVSRDVVESGDVGRGCSPRGFARFRPRAAAEPGSARLCPARGAIRPKACVRVSDASSRSIDRIRSAERGILSASARARAAGRKHAEAESAATAFLISPQFDDGLRRLSPCSASRSAAPLHQFTSSSAESLVLSVFVACSADTALSRDMLWKSAVTVGAPSSNCHGCDYQARDTYVACPARVGARQVHQS